MNTADFLAHLRRLDVSVAVEQDRLNLNAPKDVLTPDLRAELSARKEDILAFLREATAGVGTSAAFSIERVPRDGNLPLSPAQERIWASAQFLPQLPVFNLPLAFRVTGRLDRTSLERSMSSFRALSSARRSGIYAVLT